jgi:outer membrane protein TolC
MVLIAGQAPVTAQTRTLTLAEAEALALEGNRTLAAAEERAQAAALGAESADGFLFPSVQATAGALRTNDPVGVFGTKLRQRRFQPSDFDIAALNDPDAVSDWTAGIGARWEIARLDRWVGRDASRARSRAAEAMRSRTEEAVRFRTRLLFASAIRARGELDATLAADSAARAVRDRVSRRVEEGFATEADLLQAEAAVAGSQARIGGAEAAVMNAMDDLAAHLGLPAGTLVQPEVDASWESLSQVDAGTLPDEALLMGRSDLQAGRSAVEAAEADARAVTARRLPGLEAFGMVSTHAESIGAGRENNWTVGVQLSVPLFTGFQLTRGAEASRASARALALEQEQREREASNEVRAAARGVEAARGGLAAARSGSRAAEEAVRLLQRRYEEGMVTVSDLLQAQSTAAELAAAVVRARADLAMAAATLDFVRGAS